MGARGFNRLAVVDALRGVAALLVVLYHTPPVTGPLAWLEPVQERGNVGVGLFFVLSGFSIHYRWAATGGGDGFSARAFWRRRMVRLYPTYLLASVLSVLLIGLVLGADVARPERAWPHWGADPPAILLFGAQVSLVAAAFVPLAHVAIAWSLALEFQIYALYSLLIVRVRRVGVGRLVVGALAITLAWRIGLQALGLPPGGEVRHGEVPYWLHALWTTAPSRLFEWVLGLAAAEAWFGRARRPVPPNALFGLACVVAAAWLAGRHAATELPVGSHVVSLGEVAHDPLMGVGFAAVLLWAARREALLTGRRPLRELTRSLAWVGLFSYSLYLIHVPVMFSAFKLVRPLELGMSASMLLCWGITIAFAYLFFRVCEEPFLRAGRRRPVETTSAAPPPAPPAAPAPAAA